MHPCVNGLESALAERGATLEDVLQVTLYLADPDAYEGVDAALEDRFEKAVPARTTVGVTEPLGGATATLEAVAAIE